MSKQSHKSFEESEERESAVAHSETGKKRNETAAARCLYPNRFVSIFPTARQRTTATREQENSQFVFMLSASGTQNRYVVISIYVNEYKQSCANIAMGRIEMLCGWRCRMEARGPREMIFRVHTKINVEILVT